MFLSIDIIQNTPIKRFTRHMENYLFDGAPISPTCIISPSFGTIERANHIPLTFNPWEVAMSDEQFFLTGALGHRHWVTRNLLRDGASVYNF